MARRAQETTSALLASGATTQGFVASELEASEGPQRRYYAASIGLGRSVASHYRPSTLYQIR
jgi:hypothetical protein